MFWTPRPTLETSSVPSLRRPTAAASLELAAQQPPALSALIETLRLRR
jgi:hypothetical protein